MVMHRINRHQSLIVGLLLLALGTTLVSLWPALTGPFLFDDFHNLEKLGSLGGITDWDRLTYYVFGGTAGALGRPLSLLTFLLNDVSWPSDPWSFKYTNLLIHLLNGVLVFALSRQLSRLAGAANQRADWVAIGTTALWLLHPLQVSTVMLVVQRMTQLSALFTLAGLLLFVHGRSQLAERPRAAYFWMSAGIGAGGVLATLSKENGVLLTLYALVLELTLLGSLKPDPVAMRLRAWKTIFLVAPLVVLAGHFALNWDGIIAGYLKRDFTMTERLLTQPRILFDYLGQIGLPRLNGSGLFHDDYLISEGAFQPPSTLLAITGMVILLVSSVWLRRRFPVYAFAVLWFFSGHALESSFVGLELYFEHRNYLPLLGTVFALTYGACHLPVNLKRVVLPLFLLFLSLCGAMTWHSSNIWGEKAELATVWADENPSSVRAQQLAADHWLTMGQPAVARGYLNRAASHHPSDVMVQLQLLMLDCLQSSPDPSRLDSVRTAALYSPYQSATFDTLDVLRGYVSDNSCSFLGFSDLYEIVNRLLDNRKYSAIGRLRAQALYQKAKLHIAQRQLTPAIHTLDEVYELMPLEDIALLQAHLLITAGLPDDASRYLEIARESQSVGHYGFLTGREKTISELERAARKVKQATDERVDSD